MWRRLLDLRTPSPVDAIYYDHFQPFQPLNSLLVYGMDRFIAGSNVSQLLKMFDFRWPTAYYHTTALPCSDMVPFPSPRQEAAPPRLTFQKNDVNKSCDVFSGATCRWHELSRDPYYRPDFSVWIKHCGQSHVHSMAKASDISPTFYVGLAGGIAKFDLNTGSQIDTWRSSPPTKRRWKVNYGSLVLIETGNGYASGKISPSILLPDTIHQRIGYDSKDAPDIRCRLDHRHWLRPLHDPRDLIII
jgi:hypothetical protein